MNKGVPIGYRENWTYRGRWGEKKISNKGVWKGEFRATKRRKSRGYGGLGKGTKGKWKIWGIQYVKKTGKGQYQTVFKFKKKSLGFKVKKGRRY